MGRGRRGARVRAGGGTSQGDFGSATLGPALGAAEVALGGKRDAGGAGPAREPCGDGGNGAGAGNGTRVPPGEGGSSSQGSSAGARTSRGFRGGPQQGSGRGAARGTHCPKGTAGRPAR